MKFLDVLEELRIPTAPSDHHHSRSGWIQIDCPFCSRDSRRWRLGYRIDGHYFNCWSCGRHSVMDVLCEASGNSPGVVTAALRGLDVPRQSKREGKKRATTLVLPKGLGPLKRPHRRYLKERGFDVDKIERLWELQGIGAATRLAWRVFIPIVHLGRTVSWTTRSISDDVEKRYHSAGAEEEVECHKDLLFGEDYVRHAVIVHEGPLDAMATGPGAVGTCGLTFSTRQVERIAKYPVRAICFDRGRDAQARARKLCDQLAVFPGDTFNVELESKDSADALLNNPKELRRLRKEIFGTHRQ